MGNIREQSKRKREVENCLAQQEECIESSEKRVKQWVPVSLLTLPANVRNKVKVAGVSGKIGTGKNYLMEFVLKPWLLVNGYNCVVIAFADELKFQVMNQYGYTFEQVFFTKPKDVRIALQQFGDQKRLEVDEGHWIREAHKWVMLHATRGVDFILFTDNRHVNESEYIKKQLHGAVIRIDAPERNRAKLKADYTVLNLNDGSVNVEETEANIAEIAEHISETALDNYTEFDAVINNEVENQHQSAKQFIEALQTALACRTLL